MKILSNIRRDYSICSSRFTFKNNITIKIIDVWFANKSYEEAIQLIATLLTTNPLYILDGKGNRIYED